MLVVVVMLVVVLMLAISSGSDINDVSGGEHMLRRCGECGEKQDERHLQQATLSLPSHNPRLLIPRGEVKMSKNVPTYDDSTMMCVDGRVVGRDRSTLL